MLMTKNQWQFVEPKLKKMVSILGLGNKKITAFRIGNDNYSLRLFPATGKDDFPAGAFGSWMRLACLLEDAMNANGIPGHLYTEERNNLGNVKVYLMY